MIVSIAVLGVSVSVVTLAFPVDKRATEPTWSERLAVARREVVRTGAPLVVVARDSVARSVLILPDGRMVGASLREDTSGADGEPGS